VSVVVLADGEVLVSVGVPLPAEPTADGEVLALPDDAESQADALRARIPSIAALVMDLRTMSTSPYRSAVADD
jgi:hypothetical protein